MRITPLLRIAALTALALPLAALPPAPPTAAEAAAAARLSGLEFPPDQLESMLGGLAGHRSAYAEIRSQSLPNDLPPALVFDPRPPGFHMPGGRTFFDWKPARGLAAPAAEEDLAYLSVADLASLLRSRRVTSEQITRLYLARLKKYGPSLHGVVTLLEERALAEARRADAELRAGRWRGPLHGVPYVAKDLLAAAGGPTTWGAEPYRAQVFTNDAAVVRRLSAAGAVLMAKTSLGELAMGDVWFGGLTRNPWRPKEGSSGSSAGSAAAVAAGLAPFAIGSETLGSIVSPCTVCGVTGLRPTFGRVSRAGAMTLCWSLDKLGPIARSAEDCALVFNALAGRDPEDASTVDAPWAYPSPTPLRRLRVGWLQTDFAGASNNLANNRATLETLRRLGCDPKPAALPSFAAGPLLLALDAEAAAAFDELTRGRLDARLVQQGDGSWPNLFRTARFIPAVEYLQANRLRTRLIAAMDALFRDFDVIVAPPWSGDALVFGNFTGHPCVVVPNGPRPEGTEASVCFLGRLYGEADALAVAVAFQRATAFHRQRPDLGKLEAP